VASNSHDALRVIQITDTHLSAEPGTRLWGVDVDVSLTAVLALLQQRHWPADLLLATGDLVQDEGGPAYWRFCRYLEPLATPTYCLPGNHDQPRVLADTLAQGLVQRRRHAVHGAWQFILLDSVVPGSTGGHLAEAELAFLDQTLAAHPAPYAMVCLHHQPLNVDSQWLDTMTVDNGAALFAVLERHPQVRAVVWGHIHQAFAAWKGDIMLLGTPSTCVQFKPGQAQAQADERAPGYRWFELHPDGHLVTDVERIAAADYAKSKVR